MIVGIGVDTIEIQRMEKAAALDRFLQRTFTERELLYCKEQGRGRMQSLAGIFAAKEAAAKALGCGFRGFGPEAVEIGHDELGAPELHFLKEAHERAVRLEVCCAKVSISHDRTKAIAFVILEKDDNNSR